MTQQKARVAYLYVTIAYWVFMLTDGALRMLILLHFHTLGYSPLQLAYLFLVYEAAGAIANLVAGWCAARFGFNFTFYTGLVLQIVSLLALTQLNEFWDVSISIIFVMLVQGLSGIAKDFTKISAKSSVKILISDSEKKLLKWVSFLTGSKNSIKGLGFFVGALLLSCFGFIVSLLLMATALSLTLIIIFLYMPNNLPKGNKSKAISQVFSKNNAVNYLASARLFLFGARDVWFVVGVPIYLYSSVTSTVTRSDNIAFFIVGGFLSIWIIAYGVMQANTPRFLGFGKVNKIKIAEVLNIWLKRLIGISSLLAICFLAINDKSLSTSAALVIGLFTFGAIFAIISSLHSYLILSFSEDNRVTLDVGFYYSANALGRLLGTFLSGLTYQYGGIAFCMLTTALMLLISFLLTKKVT